jgi:hypothetical protein
MDRPATKVSSRRSETRKKFDTRAGSSSEMKLQ